MEKICLTLISTRAFDDIIIIVIVYFQKNSERVFMKFSRKLKIIQPLFQCPDWHQFLEVVEHNVVDCFHRPNVMDYTLSYPKMKLIQDSTYIYIMPGKHSFT